MHVLPTLKSFILLTILEIAFAKGTRQSATAKSSVQIYVVLIYLNRDFFLVKKISGKTWQGFMNRVKLHEETFCEMNYYEGTQNTIMQLSQTSCARQFLHAWPFPFFGFAGSKHICFFMKIQHCSLSRKLAHMSK